MRRSWNIILLIALLASACTLSSSPASETVLTDVPTTVALDLPTRTPIASGSSSDETSNDTTAGSSGGTVNTVNTNTNNTGTANNNTTNNNTNTTRDTQTVICNKQTSWQTYTVVAGDTLFGIAQRANSTVDTLVSANCLVDASLIEVGQTLYVPNAVAPKPTNNTNTGNDNTNNNSGGIPNDPNRYTVEVWWIVQGDSNSGFPVGCGDSMILQQSGVPTSLGRDQKLVHAFLHLTEDSNRGVGYADRGFWNPMSETNLVVKDYSVANNSVTMNLTGNIPLSSDCGNSQMEAQIAMNVMHLTGTQMATIYVNGQNMRDYFGSEDAPNNRMYNWIEYQNGGGDLDGDLIEYWVSASSGAVSGVVVGCDNYMRAIEVDNFVSGDLAVDIEIALNSLFDPNRWIPPVFRNDLKNQNLSVQSVTINGSHVDVNIGGTIMGIGVCYDPVYEAQIVQSIFQFDEVQSVKVMNGDRNLRQVSDQSGRPEVVDHVYTRSNFP